MNTIIRQTAVILIALVVGAVTAFANAPFNDNFANAIDLGNGSTAHAISMNTDATKEPGEPNHGFNPGGKSIWYKWTAPSGRNTRVTLYRSNFNTLLGIYTGTSVNSLTYIAGGNDISLENQRSATVFNPVAGTTYYIAVDGVSVAGQPTAAGMIRLDVGPNISRGASDYDNDGVTDLAVFRPSDGFWYVLGSAEGQFNAMKWGMAGDIPVAGDYSVVFTRTDRAVFRPSTGVWYIAFPDDGGEPTYIRKFGLPGDIPISGDFTSGRHIDLAVFRPSNGTWYFASVLDNQTSQVQFGMAGDIPVPGDYTNDEKTDIAVYRPSTGVWYIMPQAANGTFGDVRIIQFGQPGDKPVQGDYDGDGLIDPAIYRPSTGHFWMLRSIDNEQHAFRFGTAEDIPAPGDYDGDGKYDFALFRPSTGDWYIYQTGGQDVRIQHFGLTGDIPVTANVR